MKTYTIEKRTPASNWYLIHYGIEDPAYFLANIALNYDSDINRDDTAANLACQIAHEYPAAIGVYDGGDYVEYRAIPE